MNNNVTLIVPLWVVNSVHFLERNWTAMVGIVLIALLVSVITQFAKHRFNIKYEEQKAKTLVKWTIVTVSSGFTLLGYLIFFVQSHASILGQLPIVGRSETEVLGALYVLYNFRLNKSFKKWEAKLVSWSDPEGQTDTETPTTEPAPESFL